MRAAARGALRVGTSLSASRSPEQVPRAVPAAEPRQSRTPRAGHASPHCLGTPKPHTTAALPAPCRPGPAAPGGKSSTSVLPQKCAWDAQAAPLPGQSPQVISGARFVGSLPALELSACPPCLAVGPPVLLQPGHGDSHTSRESASHLCHSSASVLGTGRRWNSALPSKLQQPRAVP